MHVLTTDLDRTFIFSERTIGIPLEETRCIEQLDGKPISYISNKTAQLMEEVTARNIDIIPVTTRSLAQYARIELFQQKVPHYAVACNGGFVLRNGEVDEEWSKIVAKNVSTCLSFDDFRTHFAACWEMEMFRKINGVDELFYVLLIDEAKKDIDALNALHEQFQQADWTTYLHGKKFYALPKTLSKEAAVTYVLDKIQPTVHYAAGDSFMDLGMMQLTDTHFSPQHGEIYEKLGDASPVRVLDARGAAFTEQILEELIANVQ